MVLTGDFNAEPGTPSVAAVQAAGYQVAGTGTEFRTWDPVTNHVNYGIGTRRVDPLPTFGVPEVEELLAPRGTTPRQIDWIFLRDGLVPVAAEMVMNRASDGMFPSDHFGILVEARLGDAVP